MKTFRTLMVVATALMSMVCSAAFAGTFDSGSTGADGAFAPTTNTVVALPPSGVLNYTSVNIPAGVTVSFQRNTANTPVVMLASGLVKIAGTIDISGGAGTTTTLPVVLGVTNKGGKGGPGGFNGGMGGAPEQNRNGGSGYGPGGGGGATCSYGAGGSFGLQGSTGNSNCALSGPTYGSNAMLPVIGGSGGGGGQGGATLTSLAGSGGGGGGGALLLVSSAAVELTGQINAKGGTGGDCNGGSAGGSGSGGMVRIIAPAYSGGGSINVTSTSPSCYSGIAGGLGRTSIEVIPNGGTFNLALLPTLAISSIGDVPVPANPSGSGDVTAPLTLGNPLSVIVTASGIPVGSVVKLTLNNNSGSVTTANTSALAGTLQASTATGSISIPSGSSVLMASTTYTLTVAMGEALKVYAQGERVEKVNLAAVMGREMQVTLITATGKEFIVPAAVLATMKAELG